MSTGTAGSLLSPVGAPSTRATGDRVRRYVYEELGPQRGAHGATVPP
jgi:dihydrofolate synthase / folylpolyglutamate synthase